MLLVGEYDNAGNLIEETVWFGDTPVALLKPNGAGIDLFYVHADHLNTPRRISGPSDNIVVWRWDTDPFGTSAANEDPDGDSNLFVYNLRFPGQYFDSETGLHYNYFRDFDASIGKYTQSDPIGLRAGINTYAYVDSSPGMFSDPSGLGKQGGQTNIAGDDPLIPKGMGKSSSPEDVAAQIEKIEEAMCDTKMKPKRKQKLRAWVKVAKRGFTKSVVPPFLDEIILEAAREGCLLGDPNMCGIYVDLGGETEKPGA